MGPKRFGLPFSASLVHGREYGGSEGTKIPLCRVDLWAWNNARIAFVSRGVAWFFTAKPRNVQSQKKPQYSFSID